MLKALEALEAEIDESFSILNHPPKPFVPLIKGPDGQSMLDVLIIGGGMNGLAAAFALKHREMVVIDIAFRDENSTIRKWLDSFALVLIIIFCAVAVYYGFELWLKSTLRGHTTDTYLALPKWFTQASIWVGFGLLLIQAIAEISKIWKPASSPTVHQ